MILAFEFRESLLDHAQKNVDFQNESAQLLRILLLGRLFCHFAESG